MPRLRLIDITLYVVIAVTSSNACSASSMSGSQEYSSRLSSTCGKYNKPLTAPDDADARTIYTVFNEGIHRRQALLDRLAAISGPPNDVTAVRRNFLDPSYEVLGKAREIISELQQQAARREPAVSDRTVRRMLTLAASEEPINDFLAAKGLAACKTA